MASRQENPVGYVAANIAATFGVAGIRRKSAGYVGVTSSTRRKVRKQRKRELAQMCGGNPTPAQWQLIDRHVSLEWELRVGIATGDLTVSDRIEIEKMLRKDLRELHLWQVDQRLSDNMTIEEYAARRRDEAAD